MRYAVRRDGYEETRRSTTWGEAHEFLAVLSRNVCFWKNHADALTHQSFV